MAAPRRPRPLARAGAAVAGALLACALVAVAQPPAEEEERPEVLKGRGPKKRVAVEDDPFVPGRGPKPALGNPPDVRLDELTAGADETPHPRIKESFQKHAVPFDRLTLATNKDVAVRIKPIPVAPGDSLPKVFGIQELDRDGIPLAPEGVPAGTVLKRECFEDIALAEAAGLLAFRPFGTEPGPPGWTAAEQLDAAERLLAAALRFHDFARERNTRKGDAWVPIRKRLDDRLKNVRLDQLRLAQSLADWRPAREIGARLLTAYPKDDKVRDAVATDRASIAKKLLASDKPIDSLRAKRVLDEFEAVHPNSGNELVLARRGDLAVRAREALARAREKKEKKDDKGNVDRTGAVRELRLALRLDPRLDPPPPDRAASSWLQSRRAELTQSLEPDVAEVRALKGQLGLGSQELIVGVRQFPVFMSPGTAKLDSEKQAVELLFDGLLAEVPDDGAGVRYRPGAALAPPDVVAGAREFRLRTFDRAATGRYGFEAQDAVGTLKLLSARPDTWAGYPLAWLDEASPLSTSAVRVPLRQGHPDPRALFTFKVLPARWMTENRTAATDQGFGTAPLGTGPYQLARRAANPLADPNAPRELAFVPNPVYARSPDRADQPYIKEVRFVEVRRPAPGPKGAPAATADRIEDFELEALHILTDVPTDELNAYTVALRDTVQAYTAANNRRIHMLAVNHRNPTLQNKALRQGLSMAIDREAILGTVFRAGRADAHRSLTGPFPPQSWAAGRGLLTNRDLAQNRLRANLVSRSTDLKIELVLPDDDPQARRACEQIKAQIEGLVRDTDRKLVVELIPVPPRELLVRVEDRHSYDLAYVPFDYPDDWHPFALGAMLDPTAAGPGGRNWTGFLAPEAAPDADDARLGQLLNELRAYRDFGTLSGKTPEVLRLFNECVPFIPLWQLDRHTLIHKSVRVSTDGAGGPAGPQSLNPTTLFSGVARWELRDPGAAAPTIPTGGYFSAAPGGAKIG